MHFAHPVDIIERIIQEMRIYLGLQGVELSLDEHGMVVDSLVQQTLKLI